MSGQTVQELQDAATTEATRIINKLPSEVELTRRVVHSLLELAFMDGAVFAHTMTVARLQLRINPAEGGIQ
jgi:hypothetical protein